MDHESCSPDVVVSVSSNSDIVMQASQTVYDATVSTSGGEKHLIEDDVSMDQALPKEVTSLGRSISTDSCDNSSVGSSASSGSDGSVKLKKQAAKAKASGAAKKAKKSRGKYKTKSPAAGGSTSGAPSDLTKPKRALSAYNYFFRYERAKLLGCSPPSLSEESGSDGEVAAGGYTVAKKRAHRKTHGQIGFTALAKHIGQMWKQLDAENRSFYEELAAKDLKRYRKDLATYKQLVQAPLSKAKGKEGSGTGKGKKKGKAKAQKPKSGKAQDAKVHSSLTPPSPIPAVVTSSQSVPVTVEANVCIRKSQGFEGVPNIPIIPIDDAEGLLCDPMPMPVLSGPDTSTLTLFGGPLEPLFSVEDMGYDQF